ncbi:GerMN domain-containing protein [Paenibacillus woosongensis]|nr:GerMN domain-containing protein [Paenibacillus woosongensis]
MKKLVMAGTVLVLAAALAGCGQKPQAAPEGEQQPAQVTEPNVSQGAGQNNTQVEEPNLQTVQVELYFTDDDLMELTKVQREIQFEQQEDKYAEAFKQLQVSENGLFSLWEKAVLNKVSFADGELRIDIGLPDEARLGSGGEVLAIDSLKATMFQFDEVRSLELTVDGEQVESLMGHVELDHPMTR